MFLITDGLTAHIRHLSVSYNFHDTINVFLWHSLRYLTAIVGYANRSHVSYPPHGPWNQLEMATGTACDK